MSKYPRFTIDGWYACDLLGHLIEDVRIWLKQEKTTCPAEILVIERLVKFIKKYDKSCWRGLDGKDKRLVMKILK